MAKSNFTYNTNPVIAAPRGRFDLSHKVLTTLNVGDLVPVDCVEVYPGDTFINRGTFVSRVTSSFIKPVMDNLFLDTFYFFVPSRLITSHWAEMFGENNDGPWAQSKEYAVPLTKIAASLSDLSGMVQSLADYMGDIDLTCDPSRYFGPPGAKAQKVSVLPYRAFAKIYNDWFHSETVGTPVSIHKEMVGDTGYVEGTGEQLNDMPWSPSNYTGKPPNVYKVHDRYTSALPAPQKGDPVEVPLLGTAPITGQATVRNRQASGGVPATGHETFLSPLWYSLNSAGSGYVSATNGNLQIPGTSWTLGTMRQSVQDTPTDTRVFANMVADASLASSTLSADLSGVTATNVNDLRFAFQLQKMLERDAISGTRYTEYLLSHFGVKSPDARLQRSEYLGGARQPLSVQQVSQTSQTTDNSPLGGVAAFSLSGGQNRYSKSFVEHGFVLTVCCIRQYHTYQQGISRSHTRRSRVDFYDPVFSHIGMQPIKTSELFATAPADQIFGYDEAWNELRTLPNRVSGAMRSLHENNQQVYGSLDIWHFADVYQNEPVLSDAFVKETPAFVDRTLSVTSGGAPQFILDYYFDLQGIRRAPLYGTPGLIDHH